MAKMWSERLKAWKYPFQTSRQIGQEFIWLARKIQSRCCQDHTTILTRAPRNLKISKNPLMATKRTFLTPWEWSKNCTHKIRMWSRGLPFSSKHIRPQNRIIRFLTGDFTRKPTFLHWLTRRRQRLKEESYLKMTTIFTSSRKKMLALCLSHKRIKGSSLVAEEGQEMVKGCILRVKWAKEVDQDRLEWL